jgi:hypothetical protein
LSWSRAGRGRRGRWWVRDIDAITADPGIRIGGFTGYMTGSLVHSDGVATFLAGVRETLGVAEKLACRELVLSTGEINYPHVVRALREVGYTGAAGLEALPAGDPQQALARFREIFT